MNGRPLKKTILPIQEEELLAHRWAEEGDVAARNRLVEAHLWMADGMAHRFRFYGYEHGDLFGAGCEGLMIAAQKFDPTRKIRFRTYASHWVFAKIVQHVLGNWTSGKTFTGVGRSRTFFRARRVRARLLALHGEVTAEMIAAEVPGVTELMLRQIDGVDASLNAENEFGQQWIEEFVGDAPDPSESVMADEKRVDLKDFVGSMLAYLDPRERSIMRRRFMDEEIHSLAHIGRTMGISRERVRQIEMRALDKLRKVHGKESRAMEALRTTRRIVQIEDELEKMGPLQEEYTELIRRRLREIERQLERRGALEAEKDELMGRLRKLTGETPPRKPYGSQAEPTRRKRKESLVPLPTDRQKDLLERLRSAHQTLSLWVPVEIIYGWYPDEPHHLIGSSLGALRRRRIVECNQSKEWRVVENKQKEKT